MAEESAGQKPLEFLLNGLGRNGDRRMPLGSVRDHGFHPAGSGQNYDLPLKGQHRLKQSPSASTRRDPKRTRNRVTRLNHLLILSPTCMFPGYARL